jgi:hypothetical protein
MIRFAKKGERRIAPSDLAPRLVPGGEASGARAAYTPCVEQIGEYVLESKLGAGGMGAVFRARHPRYPGQLFALKVLLTESPNPEESERFAREMRALAAVQHPNVVRIFGGAVDGARPYFVMELVQGQPLSKLARDKPLDVRRAATLVRALADAAAYAHSKGIIHRDLKPDNVIVEPVAGGERPRILDFGLARVGSLERLTKSGTMLGTPAYSAPEQLDGRAAKADERADVYALGAILWYALTGRAPFIAQSEMALVKSVLVDPPRPPSQFTKGVPIQLDAVCLHCLKKEPMLRYKTAVELRDDLDRFLRGETVKAPTIGSFDELVRVAKRREVRLGLVAAIVIAILGAIALFGYVFKRQQVRREADDLYAQAMAPRAPLDAIAHSLDALNELRDERALDVAQRRKDRVLAEHATACRKERQRVLEVSAAQPRKLVALATALGGTATELVTDAVAALGSASLVGEPVAGDETQDGADATRHVSVGDELLAARDGILATLPTHDADAMLERLDVAIKWFVDAANKSRAGDPAVGELEALLALEQLDAPREPLGAGRLDLGDLAPAEHTRLTAEVFPKLGAARARRDAAGHRAAWLLVDLLILSRSADAAVRAAIDEAKRDHPDARLASIFEAVLAAAPDAGGFTSVKKGVPAEDRLAALSRFFARIGAPSAIERPELARTDPKDPGPVDRILARESRAGGDRYAPRFEFDVDLCCEDAFRAPHNEAVDRVRGPIGGAHHAMTNELDRERAQDAPKPYDEVVLSYMKLHQPEIDASLALLLERYPKDSFVLRLCADSARHYLTHTVFALLSARVDFEELSDEFEAYDAGDRHFSQSGVQSDIFFDDLWAPTEGLQGIAACREWDDRLARAMDSDPLVRVASANGLAVDLDHASRAARALRRIEELNENPPQDEAERDGLVFIALTGLEHLAKLGGPIVLPWRARAHLLAFEDPLGTALARLDLERARRLSSRISDEIVRRRRFITMVSDFFFVCAAVAAPRPDEGARGDAAPHSSLSLLSEQLLQLSLRWVRETAVFSGCTDIAHGGTVEQGLAGLEGELKSLGGEIEKPAFHGLREAVERKTADHALDATEEDRKRVRGGRYTFQRIDD